MLVRELSAEVPAHTAHDPSVAQHISANPARYVLEDAGPDALVLVDELGKGTEARAGTALAAALLEHLARINARGIFATCAPPWRQGRAWRAAILAHIHAKSCIMRQHYFLLSCASQVTAERKLDEGITLQLDAVAGLQGVAIVTSCWT